MGICNTSHYYHYGNALTDVGLDNRRIERMNARIRQVNESSDVDHTNWDRHIMGQEAAKQQLRRAFFFPRRHPSYFRSAPLSQENKEDAKQRPSQIEQKREDRTAGIARTGSEGKQPDMRDRPGRGLLLHGPPGTGKTLLAKAISKGHKATFLEINAAAQSKWVGDTEKMIEEVFKEAQESKTPYIVFIDEIDSFARQRTQEDRSWERSMKNQLLKSIDDFLKNMKGDSALIACTNYVSELDHAIRRRFDSFIFCDLPNAEERVELLLYFTNHSGVSARMTPEEWQVIRDRTYLFSGSDCEKLVKDAIYQVDKQIMEAKHWIRERDGLYSPCRPDDVGVVVTDVLELDQDSVAARRPLEAKDFLAALIHRKPTLSRDEYNKFLVKNSQDPSGGGNGEVKASIFDSELQEVYNPANEEEATLNESMRVFQQLARFKTKMADPSTKISWNHRTWEMLVVFFMVLMLAWLPSVVWMTEFVVGLCILLESTFMPLVTMVYQSLFDDSHSQANIQHHVLQLSGGLVISGVVFAIDVPFIHFSRIPLVDKVVAVVFVLKTCQHVALIANFQFCKLKNMYRNRPVPILEWFFVTGPAPAHLEDAQANNRGR
eukprot:g44787.t1